MALEDQIEKLIESNAALHTAIMEQNRLTSIIVGSMKNAPVVKAAEATGPAPQDEDAPAKPAARGRKPTAEKAAPEAKPAAKKPPTGAELGKIGAEFLDVDEDNEEEYDTRALLVKTIIAAHKKDIDPEIEKPRLRDLPDDARQKALDAIVAYKAGEPTGYAKFDNRAD